MSVLVNQGRAAIASAVVAKSIHLAWGTGDPQWDTDGTPAPNKDATALRNEVGRRALTEWSYVVADENGDITTTTGKYSKTNTPSKSVLFSFKYDYADAAGSTIREAAIFMDTQFVGGLPAGQKYFTAAQVTDAGLMLNLEHMNIPRTASSRETLDMVVTF